MRMTSRFWVSDRLQEMRYDSWRMCWVMAPTHDVAHIHELPPMNNPCVWHCTCEWLVSSEFTTDYQKWDICVSHGIYIESCRIYTSHLPWLILIIYCRPPKMRHMCKSWHIYWVMSHIHELCPVTHPHMWHGAIIWRKLRTYLLCHDDAQSYVCHDVFTRATCRTHMCNITCATCRIHLWRRALTCAPWRIHTCDMPHSHLQHI